MTEKEAAEDFWDFALSVYGREDARTAFLRLQDRDGADVPMLLWCMWRADRGHGTAREVMEAAVAFSGAWREAVVGPVRGIRRTLKGGAEGIPARLSEEARAKIAATEQSLERMQMDYLASLPCDGAASDAAALFALYAGIAGLALGGDDIARIMARP